MIGEIETVVREAMSKREFTLRVMKLKCLVNSCVRIVGTE